MFHMETERLRYFVAIAESGSLTKAGGILGISHSGLSKAISSLENETKLKLFRPLGRGLEITQEGKWFYKKALDILNIVGEMKRGERSEHKVLRIGLTGVIAVTCAASLASRISNALMITEIEVGEIESKILNGELDFGFAFIPTPNPELEFLEIGKVIFNSFGRSDLLGAKTQQELPSVVPISDFPINPQGYKNRDGWPSDVSRFPYYFVSSFAIALDFLRGGKATIYMPDFVAKQENTTANSKFKVQAVEAHKNAQTRRSLFLIKRQSANESIAMKKATQVIRAICCARS